MGGFAWVAILGGAVTLASCAGRSSRSGSSNDDETAGSSGSSASGGGTSPMGGTTPAGGAASGGAAPPGGAAGSTGSGAGGGADRPVNTDPECVDVRRDTPCTPEGKQCPALACGLGNVGRRDCLCATTWACTSCDSARPMPPDVEILPCPNDAFDGSACVSEFTVCGPLQNGEYCACFASDGGLVWDCALPPGTWPE